MVIETDRASAPQRFVDDALASFDRAVEQAGCVERHLGVAGRFVTMRFAGDTVAGILMPALEHVCVDHADADADAALTVSVFDSESTGAHMVPAPWPRDAYGPKGEIAGFNDHRFRTVFQPGIDVLQTFDTLRSVGVYWTPSYRYIPWWEGSFPLRTTFHWWTSTTRSLQPMHAGAVGLADGGVLIAGAGGAGKSTTSLACLDGGLLYAGDDYVLVDVDAPAVYSLYSTAKLVPDNLQRFPHLADLVSNADALEEQKAIVFVYRYRPEQVSTGFPVRAIVLPRVTGRPGTVLAPARPRDALTAIAPTTLFQLPGASPDVFAKVSRLVRAVPCYWLDVGTDLDSIPRAVAGLLADLR